MRELVVVSRKIVASSEVATLYPLGMGTSVEEIHFLTDQNHIDESSFPHKPRFTSGLVFVS